MHLLAQTTQPVFDSATLHRMAIGAFVGAGSACLLDLRGYLAAPPGSPFNWKLFAATVASGAIAGALTALGVQVAQ
jgi:hypothetical protein